MKHSAVLFDLDGTLLDTLQDIANSVNNALASIGLPGHDRDSYRYFVGDGRDVMAIRALPEDRRDAATLAKFVQAIDREYALHGADDTAPFDGVPEMLDSLARRGIRMAILTNKPQDSTGIMVDRLLSRWKFEIVAGSCPSVPRKPDPTAAMNITCQMKLMPSEYLFVGDSDIDMKTACSAGMYPLGALWGFRTAEELALGGAKALLKHPREVTDFL